eukprot:UN05601
MFAAKTGSSEAKATFGCTFNAKTVAEEVKGSMENQLNIDSLEPGEPTQSTQKVILWNALWAGSKLFILFLQQLFAFIAAVILAASGDVITFIVIVIICVLGDILLAGIMCTKYQRLSVGLFCKYYFCCLYNQCPIHCENKWIKLDPIELGLKFNFYGGVMSKPEETVELAVLNKIAVPNVFVYKPSYSTGVYGSYTVPNVFVYKPSYSTGVYGSYVLKKNTFS